MKHQEKLVYGFYCNRKGNEYRVVTDKYSGNDYRVVKVYDDSMKHLLGKTLVRNHGFRYALKKEMDQFN